MSPSFTSPSFLWFLLLLVPLALLYIYLARRQARVVPSINIWSSVRSNQTNRLSPPLQRFLEWLFSSLFICSTVFAAAGLHTGGASDKNHLVLLLDNSSSMTRVMPNNPNQTILDRSTTELRKRLRSIPSNTHWTVVRLAPTPRILQSGNGPTISDDLTIRSAPFTVDTSQLNRFLTSMRSDPSSRAHPARVYFLTDGQVPGLKTVVNKNQPFTVVSMGTPTDNVAITSATIRRTREKPNELSFTVHNFSSHERTFPVRLHGLQQQNLQMTVSAGEKSHTRRPLSSDTQNRNRVGLYIDTNDSFPLDNGAYLFRPYPEPVPVTIQLSSDAAPFVRSVVQSIGPPFLIKQSNPENQKNSGAGSSEGPSLLITNTPRNDAWHQYTGGTISFHPLKAAEMIHPSGDETNISRTASPLTHNLSFEELTLDQFTPIKPEPNETCLITAGEHCVAVQGTPPDAPSYVHFGFSLMDSNLVGLPEFPILLNRIFAFLKPNNSTRPLDNSMENPGKDRFNQWTRIWLKPTGSTRSASTSTAPDTLFSIQPGWYIQKSNNQVVHQMNSNFFYPAESNLNHSSPDQFENSIQPSNLESIYTKSFDLRTVMLLFAALFWFAFLYLTCL